MARHDHDLDKFRPNREVRAARRVGWKPRVLLAVVLGLMFGVAAYHTFRLRFQIRNAVVSVAKSIRDLTEPAAPTTMRASRVVQTMPPNSRGRRRRAIAPKTPTGEAVTLNPFDVYILDGDRYIRVPGMSEYALLNTRTGEIIWVRDPH